ncbi:MAG: hypothetical protein GYB68_10880, partial [Chloroflexi bacterium]|nr:hypothetical protein [Chloroflexota bacterium]
MLTHAVPVAGLERADNFEQPLEHLIQFLQYGLAAAKDKDTGAHEDV